MRLIKSNDEFSLHGVSYKGFPLVVDKDMEIVRPVYKFLLYQCLVRGRVNSKNSWWAYGQAMYDYFGFLEAQGRRWNDLFYDGEHSIVAAYRDWSIKILELSNNTVNQRLRVIVRFYNYAYNKGWVESVPYDIESVIISETKGFLAHTDRSGGIKNTPDVMLKEKKSVISILTIEQIKQLLTKATNPTLNNIVRLALQTGLRREELLSFPLKYIQDPKNLTTHSSMIRVNCYAADMSLKGDKERGIDIPRSLMERLWQYVIHERHQLITQNNAQEPNTLFVTRFGKPWSLTSTSLNNQLNNLGLQFKVNPHLFRHTYATQTLNYMREQKSRTDPLMYLKERLGHSSITTTMVYLHYLDAVEDGLVTAYQDEIDAISAGVVDAA